MAIARVKELAEASENQNLQNLFSAASREGYESDTENSQNQVFSPCNLQLTTAVRKYLVPCIRDLIQHGSCSTQTTSLVPFIGCFPRRASLTTTHIHAWDLILGMYFRSI